MAHCGDIHKRNNRNLILRKSRDRAVFLVVYSYKFIFSIEKKVLRENIINGRASYTKFFNLKLASKPLKFRIFKIIL